MLWNFQKIIIVSSFLSGYDFEEHLTEMNLGETFLLMNQVDSAAYYLNLCSDFFVLSKSDGSLLFGYPID